MVPEEVTDRAALAKLRLVRKSELPEIQRADPPFGGLSVDRGRSAGGEALLVGGAGVRARAADAWTRGGRSRALRAAGFRAGDVVHNSFSYHLTPAGSMIETAAHALGCAVIPGGTAPTEAQAIAAAQFRATAYGGTPSFLKVLLDRAAELGLDLSSLTKASVTAEALAGGAAEGAGRARGAGPPVVRDGGRGAHRLRDAGAGRSGAGRGRHPGDRPPGHGRSGAVRGGGRGAGDGAVGGPPAPALRDGGPLGDSPRAESRAGGRTCESAAGWGVRTSRRRCGDCSCIRATWRSWCVGIRWCAGRGWSSPGRRIWT